MRIFTDETQKLYLYNFLDDLSGKARLRITDKKNERGKV